MVAGEASGDMYGAEVARALFRQISRLPNLRSRRSARMRDAGVQLEGDIRRTAVVGPFEVISSLGILYGVFRRLAERIEAEPPRAAILIDFPGFQSAACETREGCRHAGHLLHQPAGVGVARRADQADPPSREQDAGDLSIRRRNVSKRGRGCGVRRASVDRNGARDKDRKKSSANRTSSIRGNL